MGRKRRCYNLHTCECCEVNDDNVDEYTSEDADYGYYTGVKYYTNLDDDEVEDVDPEDISEDYLPENLDDGWYCNICIQRASSSLWEEESTDFTYDDNGTPYGEEGYGEDY